MVRTRRSYPHFVCFNDLGIPLEAVCGYAPDGSWGVRDWVHAGMPRILPEMERCVLYMQNDDLDATGGTAFVMSVPWLSQKGRFHYYVVTCAHVLDDGYPKAVVPKQSSIVLTNAASKWVAYPDREFDLAVVDVTEPMAAATDFVSAVPHGSCADQDVIKQFDIGIGDEICMVGLYHEDEHGPYDPVGRFGAVGGMAKEGQHLIKADEGEPQPSHLVDMRSRDGFSGSPVFVYRTPVTNLKSITPKGDFNLVIKDNMFIRLFGVHRGQFREVTTVRAASEQSLVGSALEIDSAMTLVVPAWALVKLVIKHMELVDMRKKREDAYEPPKGKVAKTESKKVREPNPDHEADFKRLLRAGAKSPKSSG